VFALALLGLVVGMSAPLASAAVADAPRCSTTGTWKQGELNVYWFDVEQGDSQLVVGPTGRTMLIDLGESAYNTTGTGTRATRVASAIRAICGIASGPVHLDYVVASHHHLDHIGYGGVPGDTTAYGLMEAQIPGSPELCDRVVQAAEAAGFAAAAPLDGQRQA